LRRSKRPKIGTNFGPNFVTALLTEDDLKTYQEAMKSIDAYMLIFGTDMNVVKNTKNNLSSNFDMKDLGEAYLILCIKII
jgi:hypothetical protein